MNDWADETSDDDLDDAVFEAVGHWVDAHGDDPEDFADSVVSAWCRAPEATAAPAVVRKLSWIATSATLAAAAAMLLVMVLAPRTSGPLGAITTVDGGIPVGDAAFQTPPSIPAEVGALRAQMHAVLVARCVPCHVGGHDDAVAGALQGFDVAAPQWWQPVSERQLGVMQDRIESAHGKDSREGRLVDAFVRAELGQRRG